VAPLPLLSGREVVRVLARLGFEVDRQPGSHIVLRQIAPPYRRVTVPDHNEVARGTLRSVLQHADVTQEEFLRLL